MNTDLSLAPWVQALPQSLRTVLDIELAAGNRISYAAGCGLDPSTSVFVLLTEHTTLGEH